MDDERKGVLMPLMADLESNTVTGIVEYEDGERQLSVVGPPGSLGDGDDVREARISRKPGSPLYNMSVQRRGPAKVNSQAYRDGWERIFRRSDEPMGEA